MKFITENELREIYKKKPFTQYKEEEGVRLTPGARQFLIDRGINMFTNIEKTFIVTSSDDADNTNNKFSMKKGKKENILLMDKQLILKLKKIELILISVSEDLINNNIAIYEKLIEIKNIIKECRDILSGKKELPKIEVVLNDDNLETVEINEIHMKLKKGSDILKLKKVQCEMEELLLDILIDLEKYAEKKKIEYTINQIKSNIKKLDDIINETIGGGI